MVEGSLVIMKVPGGWSCSNNGNGMRSRWVSSSGQWLTKEVSGRGTCTAQVLEHLLVTYTDTMFTEESSVLGNTCMGMIMIGGDSC